MAEKDTVESIEKEREAILAPCRPAQYRVLTRIATNPDNHLVVSFGGGSVPGMAGNTALAALLVELEILPHVKEIWGTSAGAIVGGALASGTTPERGLRVLARLKDRKMVDFTWWELLKGLARRRLPDGLIRGRQFRIAIEESLTATTFEACPIPFRAIAASDDGWARRVIFREGPLADAIMASMCLPGISWPVRGEEFGYFDGGLVEKTPLLSILDDHKRAGHKTRLCVLATHYDDRARITRPRGFLERFVSTMTAMEETIWEYQVAEARAADDAKIALLNPRIEHGGMLDFDFIDFNYLWCRKRFKEQLSNAGLAARFDAR